MRVRACGVCGTDLHLHDLGLYAPGVTPGHEIAGEVDALGPGVEGLAPGDPVVVEPLHSCGACRACREGRDAICPDGAIYGLNRDGGFAEHALVPARRVFRAPADLPMAVAALAEPLAVAIHGLRRGGFEAGQRILVLGAGPVGLATVAAARFLGAGPVWASARYPHQAERARRLGAARVLGEAEAAPAALGRLPEAERPDLVMETVGGHADTLGAAVAALRPGGVISVLGLFMQDVALPSFPLVRKEVTLAWSNCYVHTREHADFEDAVALLDAERERLASLATHSVPLDEIPRAYALAADKRSGVIKVTVQP